MENDLIGIFGIIIFLILIVMVIILPVVFVLNWKYSKRLRLIIVSLPESVKSQMVDDIKKESERSIIYRSLGENLFKEDDFLIRLFKDKSVSELVSTNDLNECIKLKKNLKFLLKVLASALVLSVILALAALLLFS